MTQEEIDKWFESCEYINSAPTTVQEDRIADEMLDFHALHQDEIKSLAKLGALVNQMPDGFEIYHGEKWQVEAENGEIFKSFSLLEALEAALEEK